MDLPQFIRDEARRAEGFAVLLKSVEKLAALEQSEREAKAAVERARSEAAEVKAQTVAALAKQKQTEDDSREACAALLQRAKLDAEEMIVHAKRNADQIVSDAMLAKDKAQKAAAAAEGKAKEAQKALAEYQDATAQESARLEAIKAAIAKFTATA